MVLGTSMTKTARACWNQLDGFGAAYLVGRRLFVNVVLADHSKLEIWRVVEFTDVVVLRSSRGFC